MIEYEYSFNVSDLGIFINFCEKNGFTFKGKTHEERIIFRNKTKTDMGRITISTAENKTIKTLDFKQNLLTDNALSERKESKSLEFQDLDSVLSILDYLGFVQDNTLIRERYVYEKENVKFEMDEYSKPNSNKVVSIEGDKEKVDKIYLKVSKLVEEK